MAEEKTLPLFADAGVRFGPDFLRDHAGQIITDPRIALVELIANAYDAGADTVHIKWPNEIGDVLEIEDNGTGMTAAEFDRRWRTLNYKRTTEQGLFAQWPPDSPRKHQRIAFGQNGKGRHGAFCFSDIYNVETWRDGALTLARLEIATSGGAEPFLSTVEDGGARDGHGTIIRAIATRKLITEEQLSEAVGSKFLVDPTFKIIVNDKPLDLFELGVVTTTTINVEEYGEVKIHLIDPSVKDRTTHLKGITWWVHGRMVGESSWSGLTDSGAVLDGRTAAAKTYAFVIEADILKPDVKPDWSGFYASARRNAVVDAVHKAVVDSLRALLAKTRKERKRAVIEQHLTSVKNLPDVSKHMIDQFIDDLQTQCPTMSEGDLSRTVGVLAKMEQARSGYDLLRRLEACTPEDIDKWNDIMLQWTALDAELVLSELQKRLALIERLQSLVHSTKTDELHDLQPLFEKGLWIFGPEYEAVDFRSNRGMAHVIRKFLKVEEDVTVSKRRMDFIALPDASIGAYSADAYSGNGEVAGYRKVLILELKKGGFELKQAELDQGRDYAKELRVTGAVQRDTSIVVYVLGASLEAGLEFGTSGHHTVIEPMTYDVVLSRAHARTFNLQRKLRESAATLPLDADVSEILSAGDQSTIDFTTPLSGEPS
jgi:hypothetical protein